MRSVHSVSRLRNRYACAGDPQTAGTKAELQAVEHEMAAVEEALQRLDEASSAAHAQGDEDAWSEDEEQGARLPAGAQPAAAAGEAAGPVQELSEGSVGPGGGGGGGSAGELQRVVMSKRLAGLQSRQRELEVSAWLPSPTL